MPIPVGGSGATVTVEAGFGSTPFATSPTWTDISDYVVIRTGIGITRGRSDEQSDVAAGTLTVTLRNGDKRFTPGYTAGPYGNDVQPRTPFRVYVTYNGTVYHRFTGWVQTWQAVWPGTVTESAAVQVVATDLLGILEQRSLATSLTEVMLATSPTALYPLTEANPPGFDYSDADQPHLRKVTRRGGGYLGWGNSGGEFPSRPSMSTLYVKNGADVDGNSRRPWTGLSASLDMQAASTAVAVGGWVKWQNTPTEDQYLASIDIGATYAMVLWWDDAYGLCAGLNSAPSTTGAVTVSAGSKVADGSWHFVVALFTNGAPDRIELYVDGASVGVQATADAAAPSDPATLVIGGADYPAAGVAYSVPRVAWYSHWGVWVDDAAIDLDVATIWDAGRRNQSDQKWTHSRAAWLLDMVGFDASNRTIGKSQVEVPTSAADRSSAASYLRDLAAAERGVFYSAGDGTAVYRGRQWRQDRGWGPQLVANRTFETNTTGWQGNAFGADTTTLSRSSTQAHGGTYSLKVTLPTLSTGSVLSITPIACTVGQTYIFQGWVYVPSGVCDLQPIVAFYANGTPVTAKDEWAFVDFHWTAPSTGTFYFGVGNVAGQTYTNGQFWYVDDVSCRGAASAPKLTWNNPGETFTSDVDSVVNIADVAHAQGAVKVRDRDSVLAYGPRVQSVATETLNANYAHATGEYMLALRADPAPRLATFTWDLLTWPTDADNETALSLDVNDLFTAGDLPEQAPVSAMDLWVEGVTETIGVDQWTVTFNTTPAPDMFPDGVWTIGTSELDTTSILGY